MEKRAVVIGINYANSSRGLSGCISDANRISKVLKERGYNVLLLTDKIKPTRNNIIESFRWLLHSCGRRDFGKPRNFETVSSGTKLYFHFSGHGAQITDKNDDEPDRLDEAIVTYDNKNISDDYIHKNLINVIPEGVQLRGTVDCCNSRTNLDLRWTLNKFNNSYAMIKTGSGRNSYCDAIIISGASDNGSSYDTVINGVNTGVLTYYYLEALSKNNYSMSVNELLDYIQKRIDIKGYKQKAGICFGKQMSITTNFML